MLDSEGYNIKYVQKSSPGKSDDFIFAHIFKFHTCDGLKYIIRAEMHKYDTFVVKYYASIHKNLDNKYSMLTNRHRPIKIFITCASILPILLSMYPTASFAFNGSRTVDLVSDKIEGYNTNQRFRIYRHIADALIGRETFEHYEFPEISAYLLVNRNSCTNTDTRKEEIKDMFLDIYNFDSQI